MENVILLSARYGLVHKLTLMGGNLWHLDIDKKSTGTYRLIGFEGEHEVGNFVYALDPEGGPFLSVGSKIEGYTIKSISSKGVFELVKNNENENENN